MPGKVEIKGTGRDTTISLDGDTADITAGGSGQDGTLILRAAGGEEIARVGIILDSKGNSVANIRFKGTVDFDRGNSKCIHVGTSTVEVFDPFGKTAVTIQASPTEPTLTVGGNSRKAVIEVLDADNTVGVRMRGNFIHAGSMSAGNETQTTGISGNGIQITKDGKKVLSLEGEQVQVGNQSVKGRLLIWTSNTGGVSVGGDNPEIVLGPGGLQNTLRLSPEKILLNNDNGATFQATRDGVITCGGSNTSGELSLLDGQNRERIRLSANQQRLITNTANGQPAFLVNDQCDLYLGGADAGDGSIFIKSKRGQHRIDLIGKDGQILLSPETGDSTVDLNSNGRLTLRAPQDTDSVLKLTKADGNATFVAASNGELSLGNGGAEGDLKLKTKEGKQTARLSSRGDLFLGGGGVNGDIRIYPTDGVHGSSDGWSISLDGSAGDIFLKNADCAEEFEVAGDAEPGTVVVIDEDGRMRQCQEAYDKKVAGVISGAGDYKPGIVLDKQMSSEQRSPVALVGKAFCKVDADYGAVSVGDLLTTSPTVGHAMKAADPFKAFGSVIGKALKPLSKGHGLIPILIALQ